MSSSYNTPCIKHKLVVSIYSNTGSLKQVSRCPTFAIWCRVVQFRDVSPHNFDGLAMSGLAFSVAPLRTHNFDELSYYVMHVIIDTNSCYTLKHDVYRKSENFNRIYCDYSL